MDETTRTPQASQTPGAEPARVTTRGPKKEEMNFVKTFLASMLGFFAGMVALGIVSILGIIMIIGALSSAADEEPVVAENTVLVVELSGGIPEFSYGGSIAELLDDFTITTTYDYLRALEGAAEDENIAGVWLKFEGYQGSAAQLEALSRGIRAFRESGKFVYASSDADGYGEGEYVLASAADSLFLPHSGFVELNGIYTVLEFYTPLMEKLNIEPVVVRAGAYKSAVEPFTRESASPENEMMMQALIDGQFGRMRALVAEGRGLSVARIDSIVNNYPVIMPEEAVRLGLVDRLVYNDEIENIVETRAKGDTTGRLRTIELDEYLERNGFREEGNGGDVIAVVYAVGSIVTGENEFNPSPIFGGDQLGSESFVREMRRVREDEDVKAIVLRINSPGGGLSPSIAMWREVKLAAEKKPVIVSMASVAASGGYYIAAPADEIIAEETTLTGSIGIFALGFNVDGFYEQTIGINTQTIRSSPHADILSATRDLTEEERAFAESRIRNEYRKFLAIVAEGRGMSIDAVDSIAQGRVWTGAQAKELGLVDELGGLDLAIQRAADSAVIQHYRVEVYPKPKNRIEMLLEMFDVSAARLNAASAAANPAQYYQAVRETLNRCSGLQARMVGIRTE